MGFTHIPIGTKDAHMMNGAVRGFNSEGYPFEFRCFDASDLDDDPHLLAEPWSSFVDPMYSRSRYTVTLPTSGNSTFAHVGPDQCDGIPMACVDVESESVVLPPVWGCPH